ncbi:tetratricopeptide repeat protein 1 isoform X2 [Parambassis ranga]|uniref:Tetratricopeptide repeat protein 1 n=1 Tax=Parambassis ranga TaxID=210632 RepID=A0A6P7JLZ8_9TELE|nr:tetratricopeptide repeat protein 1-like isoform X2 [Parambassis ranga]
MSTQRLEPKKEGEEEDFYDCQESWHPPDLRGEEEEAQKDSQQDTARLEDFHTETSRLTDRTDDMEETGGRPEVEKQDDRLEDEEQGHSLQEDEEQGHSLQEDEEQGHSLQDEEQGHSLQDEEQGHSLQDEEQEQGHSLQEDEEQGHSLQEDEEQGHSLQDEEQGHSLQDEEQGHSLQEDEEQGHSLQEDEEQGHSLQEDDTEMEKGVGRGVEFDDDLLREVERELTEEEKESRRQQSLTLKEKGNDQFKVGDWSEAEQSYTEALGLCPVGFSGERAVLFSNRAAARLHQDLKDQAIADCSRAIELNPDYVRALLRRAELYEQTEKLDEALEDYKRVLDRDPSHTGARQACMRLPQQIQERNERLKEEMMSKLKDLGNMILRPFGLSTNNFQVNQDPASGSYSINFTQSPDNNNR